MKTIEKDSLTTKINRLISSLADITNQFENQEIKDFGKGAAADPDCPPCIFGAALIHAGWHPPSGGVLENEDALAFFLRAKEEDDPIRLRALFPTIVSFALERISVSNDTCQWDDDQDREQLLKAADLVIDALQRWVLRLEAQA